METKICTKCGLEKPVSEFYKTLTTIDGYTYNCIGCYQIYREQHRERAKSYMRELRLKNKVEINRKKREYWRNKDPKDKMILQAKYRAKRTGIEFSITTEDFEYPYVCPLLDLPLVPGVKEDYEQSPSLDRIDSRKGYIPDNVWVISKRANTMKNNATKEELLKFALNVIKYFGDDDIVRTMWKHIELEDKELQG